MQNHKKMGNGNRRAELNLHTKAVHCREDNYSTELYSHPRTITAPPIHSAPQFTVAVLYTAKALFYSYILTTQKIMIKNYHYH